MNSRIRFYAALSLGVVLACGDGTGPTPAFTIRGTIQNNTSAAIPVGARVVAVWVVSAASPDYTYVFGEGTIDRSNGTFELSFSGPPPAAALNASALGVAILTAVTNPAISDGDDITDYPGTDLIGAAGSYGAIYIGDSASATAVRSWAADFAPGFGVGEGEDTGAGFDRFVPSDPSSVILTIDDFGNIEFVNWT